MSLVERWLVAPLQQHRVVCFLTWSFKLNKSNRREVAAPIFYMRTGGLSSSSDVRSSLQLMMSAANQVALGIQPVCRHPLRNLSNTPLTSTPVSSISGYSSDSSSSDSENEQMMGELSDFS